MWCDVESEELSSWVDGEIGEARADELRVHVANCPACRAELEQIRRVDDTIRSRAVLGNLTGLRARVVAATPGARFRPVWRWGSAAAALLVAAVLGSRCGEPVPEPERDGPDPRVKVQEAYVDSLELDAASLRVELLAASTDSPAGVELNSKIDAVLLRLERLRRDGLVPLKGE